MSGRPPAQFSGGCFCVVVDAGPPVHSHRQSLMHVVVWPGRQLLERQQLQVGRVLRVDDVDAGDVGRAVGVGLAGLAGSSTRGTSAGRARSARACAPGRRPCPRSARTSTRVAARLVTVKSVGGSPGSSQILGGDLVEQPRVRRIAQRVRLQPEAARDQHHVLAVLVLQEVDRRGLLRLRQVVLTCLTFFDTAHAGVATTSSAPTTPSAALRPLDISPSRGSQGYVGAEGTRQARRHATAPSSAAR